MRYRLLQTIRHYAMAKAQQAGETQETRERHVAYYLALAEEADPKLLGTEQAPWTARLDAERENLMAALNSKRVR